jgi:hypothetical protein
MSGSVETQARAFADEVRGGALEAKNWMLDLGHPLLNRIAESFVKAAGIGAVQAVARESYFMAIEGEGGSVSGATGSRKRSFPELNGKLVTAPIFQSAGSALLLSSVTMSK